MTTATATPDTDLELDSRLDEGFGTREPDELRFAGDIVFIYFQDPKPEWVEEARARGEDEPTTKIVVVIRDWAASFDDDGSPLDKAVVRRVRMNYKTARKSTFMKHFLKPLETGLGVEITRSKQLLGIEGDWIRKDLKMGKFTLEDFIGYVGKPSIIRPDFLPPYVPQRRSDDDDAAGTVTADTPAPAREASEEAKTAYLDLIGDGSYTEAELRAKVTRAQAFRTKFPYEFALAVSGQLAKTLVGELALTFDGNKYGKAQ